MARKELYLRLSLSLRFVLNNCVYFYWSVSLAPCLSFSHSLSFSRSPTLYLYMCGSVSKFREADFNCVFAAYQFARNWSTNENQKCSFILGFLFTTRSKKNRIFGHKWFIVNICTWICTRIVSLLNEIVWKKNKKSRSIFKALERLHINDFCFHCKIHIFRHTQTYVVYNGLHKSPKISRIMVVPKNGKRQQQRNKKEKIKHNSQKLHVF